MIDQETLVFYWEYEGKRSSHMNEDAIIYLDHAATTSLAPEVYEAMKPYFSEKFYNAASLYAPAQEVHAVLDDARQTLADLLGAETSNEIYFTGGGSESDNWAIKGVASAYREKGRHIITSKIEHHAVLRTMEYLETLGYQVTYLSVDERGMVSLEELEQAIREDTILISIMTANNEIGTIEPIQEIGRIAQEHGVLFHTDAVQAFGHIPVNVRQAHVDLLSISAHKFRGPKGVGALYIRNGVSIDPLIHGGAQERSKRAGTHNLAGIVGMVKAAQRAVSQQEMQSRRQKKLRDDMIERLEKEIEFVTINGDRIDRLANNINVSFSFIEGDTLLILLDQMGICVSAGSACTSGSPKPSHVLLAIGLTTEQVHSSIRISLGEETTKEELDRTVEVLKEKVALLRKMSPLYQEYCKKKEHS